MLFEVKPKKKKKTMTNSYVKQLEEQVAAMEEQAYKHNMEYKESNKTQLKFITLIHNMLVDVFDCAEEYQRTGVSNFNKLKRFFGVMDCINRNQTNHLNAIDFIEHFVEHEDVKIADYTHNGVLDSQKQQYEKHKDILNI